SLLAEEGERGGVAVQVAAAADGADLAVAEEAGERHAAEGAREALALAVRRPVQRGAAAQAREEQCPARGSRAVEPRERALEVGLGGARVAQVELHDLALVHVR